MFYETICSVLEVTQPVSSQEQLVDFDVLDRLEFDVELNSRTDRNSVN